MRFFSKLACICNICFLLSFLLRMIESSRRVDGNYDMVIYQPLEGTIAILGLLLAVIFNAAFILLCGYWVFAKKIKNIPLWIVLFNILVFPFEVYFLFWLK
jgi:hypothetical protein